MPASALAEDDLVFKRGAFREETDHIALTVGFREMFGSELRKRLRSGFATTVVMRTYVYEKGGQQPVAFSARTLRAVYDLWDEQFLLRIDEPMRTRHLRLADQREVVDRLTSLWRTPVARLREVRPGRQYFVAIIAEVNPISDELLAEVRRWLRTPHGAQHRLGGESFFGSFVSVFLNDRIRRAEKTFRVRTQPFYRRP